ncbi:MAG: hypothetical protein RLZZ515_2546 [Cyanobacteriota bacterium]|jgi:hypothetical protein
MAKTPNRPQPALETPTPTPTPALEMVEEHQQGTPLDARERTIIRISRRSDRQNWRTYCTECY